MSRCTFGTFTPLPLLMTPPAATVQEIRPSSGEASSTVSSMAPSLSRIREPRSTCFGRSA